MAEQIQDRHSLKAWLGDKPREWAQILAFRSALRVLPVMGLRPDAEAVHLAVFRAMAVSWSAHNWLTLDLAAAARASAYAANYTANREHQPIVHSVYAADAAATAIYAPHSADAAAANDVVAEAAARAAFHAARGYADAAYRKRDYGAAAAATNTFWSELVEDIRLLEEVERERDSRAAWSTLLYRQLWNASFPTVLEEIWFDLVERMSDRDPHAWIWRDWYERRLRGSREGFVADSVVDRALSLRLGLQSDRFWKQQPHLISAAIALWATELETRELTPEPERQNPVAAIFRATADGQIDLDLAAGNDEIQHDGEAHDRHLEAFAAATLALRECSGNAASRTRTSLERYLDALGATVDDLRPNQLITRGEALRQELKERDRDIAESRDTDLPPLPGTALLALRGLVTAHNLLVGLDPALARRDEVRLGPDAIRTQISRNDAEEVITRVVAAGILTIEAQDALEQVVAETPSEPDPDNRLSRRLTETIRNLGRKIVSGLTRHMDKALWGVAGGGAGIALASQGALLMVGWTVGCIATGRWVLSNEQWFRENFGWSEPMRRLVDRMIEELRKLPLG